MTFKKLVLATALAMPAFVASAPAFAQARLPAPVIAVVDTDKVVNECNACKTASAQLQSQAAQVKQFADQLGAPLQTEAQSLQTALRAANGKPDAALQTRIDAFQGKQQNAQGQVEQQQNTFQRNVDYVRSQIVQSLKPVIDQIAQQRGATVALDKSAVLFAAQTIDITADVLAALNGKLTTVNVVAPPLAPAPAQGAPAGTPAQQKPPGR